MYDAPKKGETRRPKHTHYVSLGNGHVYPALRNLPGYEDDNPGEWRHATAAEKEAFLAGKQPKPQPGEEVRLDSPVTPTRATPQRVTLAEDDADELSPPPAPPMPPMPTMDNPPPLPAGVNTPPPPAPKR